MTLPANLDMYISAAMFVIGGYLIALYLGMIVWTFRDIHSRSRDILAQIMATLLVAVFTLPGLLVYYLLRPHETLAQRYERDLAEEALLHDLDDRHVCPGCQHQVETDFVVCPYCHHQLRLRCVGCGRLLRPEWDVCPYCGLFRDQNDSEELVAQEDGQEFEADSSAGGDVAAEDEEGMQGDTFSVGEARAELSGSVPSSRSDSGSENGV